MNFLIDSDLLFRGAHSIQSISENTKYAWIFDCSQTEKSSCWTSHATSGCCKSLVSVIAEMTTTPKSVSHAFMLQEDHLPSSSQDTCHLQPELPPPCHADIHYYKVLWVEKPKPTSTNLTTYIQYLPEPNQYVPWFRHSPFLFEYGNQIPSCMLKGPLYRI